MKTMKFFALILDLPIIMTAFGQLHFYNFNLCFPSSRKVILDQAFRLLIFLKDKLNIDCRSHLLWKETLRTPYSEILLDGSYHLKIALRTHIIYLYQKHIK